MQAFTKSFRRLLPAGGLPQAFQSLQGSRIELDGHVGVLIRPTMDWWFLPEAFGQPWQYLSCSSQAQQGASLDLVHRVTTDVNLGRNVTLYIFNGDIS